MTEAETASVPGTITYRQRSALPVDAEVQVQLVDVSRADAPATVIGESRFAAAGRQVPLPFDVRYDPAKIDPRMSYAVSARITIDGQLRFINDTRYPVLTRGAPSKVEMVLAPVGAPR